VLGGHTDPRNGPPDSPPGRPSGPLPACRPERVPLLGSWPAPKGQRWRQALFLLPLGRRRGPRGASRTVHAPYTALSTSVEKVPIARIAVSLHGLLFLCTDIEFLCVGVCLSTHAKKRGGGKPAPGCPGVNPPGRHRAPPRNSPQRASTEENHF